MKFRYYITDTFDGLVKGTNDAAKARECAACTEYFVVDTQTGKWISVDGKIDVINMDEKAPSS